MRGRTADLRGTERRIALAVHRAGGHAALGWGDAGRLAPGALADLCTVSLEGVRLAGTPVENAVESVVFAAAAGDVRDVMAGGRWIVRDGAHVSLDVPAELRAVLL